MISSPCSAEQAQRTKLCPASLPRKVFNRTASPRTFRPGLCCSQAAQPAAEAAGQGPPRIKSMQKALDISSGASCASSETRRAAGHAQLWGSSRGQGPPRMRSMQKALEPNRSGGFLHPLFLLLRIQCTLACFCRRLRQSAIMAMNSEFVGLPLMFETV